MRLIVNADDFGRSREINAAVVQAHREGVLSSASLMAGGEAFDEAVELARENPGLATGLHVTVSDGRPVLEAERIAELVDETGMLHRDPAKMGVRCFFNTAARRQMRMEVEAQFARFAAMGLALSHVDGHQHMHVHPTVLEIVLPLARRYGARGFRVPKDDLMLALRHDRRNAAIKVAWTGVFGLLGAWTRRRIGKSFVVPEWTYGFMQSGRMEEGYVMEALRRMRGKLVEMYFHPTIGERMDEMGANPGDLRTLLSSAVRGMIEARGVRLSRY